MEFSNDVCISILGTGIASMAVMRPDLVMKAIIPVVMAGIVAIYGLVVSVIMSGKFVIGVTLIH